MVQISCGKKAQKSECPKSVLFFGLGSFCKHFDVLGKFVIFLG